MRWCQINGDDGNGQKACAQVLKVPGRSLALLSSAPPLLQDEPILGAQLADLGLFDNRGACNRTLPSRFVSSFRCHRHGIN
jgi:hypothetical protein